MVKLEEVKAVPTFALHADTFLTEIIVTVLLPYSSCKIETSFNNMERLRHAMI